MVYIKKNKKLSRLLGGTVKLLEPICYIIDGKTDKNYLNYEKYLHKKVHKGI